MKSNEEENEERVRLGNVTQPFVVDMTNWNATPEEEEPEIRVSSCRATWRGGSCFVNLDASWVGTGRASLQTSLCSRGFKSHLSRVVFAGPSLRSAAAAVSSLSVRLRFSLEQPSPSLAPFGQTKYLHQDCKFVEKLQRSELFWLGL